MVSQNCRTLIFTNTYDVTTDIVLEQLENKEEVFKLNFNLLSEYDFYYEPGRFEVVDPVGRKITSDSVRKGYFRKPVLNPENTPEEKYVQSELWYAYRSLVWFLWRQEKLVVVEPFTERGRLNKFYQMEIAKKYFNVPEAYFVTRHLGHQKNWQATVTKSLTGEVIGDKNFFTTLVEQSQLDSKYPWFLQEYVKAGFDLTVVYVRGQIFSFKLERSFLEETVDFRAPQDGKTWSSWQFEKMPKDFEQAICEYMALLKLDFGRLDFLIDEIGNIHFCEVNPNGQFAWLDLNNETGLISYIAKEISPDTEVYPIPYNPFR